MNVLAYDNNPNQYDELITPVSLSKLLTEADVISIHAKLNESSRNLISFLEQKLILIKTQKY